MIKIIKIINEEIMTTVANLPQFGDRLNTISETGEGNAGAYPFKFDDVSDNEVYYYFDTEEDSYIVLINHWGNDAWELEFGVDGGEGTTVTNRGRLYKVMGTILQITNDFIDKYKPNVIRIKPAKDEEREDDKRRFNLYMQYIKKNMRRDYYVHQNGEHIIIERKIKIKRNISQV